ncbi:hypothetical protein A2U01_0055993 [Trifolium medium]|uniref:Uncharacterized protein n=1 Tax=Trifolium medium TaxID=97028 RepID=A0A392RF67_9FABA|nr:hypothetical protein [Trifolium medium]
MAHGLGWCFCDSQGHFVAAGSAGSNWTQDKLAVIENEAMALLEAIC